MNLLLLLSLLVAGGDDVLIANFEGNDYGAWTVTGSAFGPGPARGTLPNQMPVSGFLGKGLVNSYAGGDASTGTLTSPEIKIERKIINFLVGGGKHATKTCINLLVGGKVVRTATGPNDRPGGSEQLDWHSWNVADLEGKMAVLEIVDQATGKVLYQNKSLRQEADYNERQEQEGRLQAIQKIVNEIVTGVQGNW